MADAFLVPWVARDYSRLRAGGSLQKNAILQREGGGSLAGSFPAGVTSVEGVPTSATVQVKMRSPGDPGDGAVVAEIQSAPDGTWSVTGLPTHLRYDVVGRKDGFNDVIVSNVQPVA